MCGDSTIKAEDLGMVCHGSTVCISEDYEFSDCRYSVGRELCKN